MEKVKTMRAFNGFERGAFSLKPGVPGVWNLHYHGGEEVIVPYTRDEVDDLAALFGAALRHERKLAKAE